MLVVTSPDFILDQHIYSYGVTIKAEYYVEGFGFIYILENDIFLFFLFKFKKIVHYFILLTFDILYLFYILTTVLSLLLR